MHLLENVIPEYYCDRHLRVTNSCGICELCRQEFQQQVASGKIPKPMTKEEYRIGDYKIIQHLKMVGAQDGWSAEYLRERILKFTTDTHNSRLRIEQRRQQQAAAFAARMRSYKDIEF